MAKHLPYFLALAANAAYLWYAISQGWTISDIYQPLILEGIVYTSILDGWGENKLKNAFFFAMPLLIALGIFATTGSGKFQAMFGLALLSAYVRVIPMLFEKAGEQLDLQISLLFISIKSIILVSFALIIETQTNVIPLFLVVAFCAYKTVFDMITVDFKATLEVCNGTKEEYLLGKIIHIKSYFTDVSSWREAFGRLFFMAFILPFVFPWICVVLEDEFHSKGLMASLYFSAIAAIYVLIIPMGIYYLVKSRDWGQTAVQELQ